jgi:methylase of polypeptide subunit release factors
VGLGKEELKIAMAEINEWTFTADVCKTIQGIIAENPALPFSGAEPEEGAEIGRKRRDLTLYDRDGRLVLTGEIRFPDSPGGQGPCSDALVTNAFEKANAKGVEYFFTWNVNQLYLWRTFEVGKPVADRDFEHFNVTSITGRAELSDPLVRGEIEAALGKFLHTFARILGGAQTLPSRPLDEKFVRRLESALELPILQTRNAITRLYSADRKFARSLDAWMRDSQGWIISTDTKILRDNQERAAKFSCYVLVNKIVFQLALRRRFPSLRRVRVPDTVKTAGNLRELFQSFFHDAKRRSRDYETVFDGDFGDTLPFLEDATVASWREFLREIEGFDFSKIEYDIIGHIFERLISPEERHRYGQHYTRSEIVDLINAFSIREADATLLDPACGGGTFLVRAYALKRELSGGLLSHVDLLQQIKGIDISAYAAHLSTINLATRDLIDERNYPLVARSDFFKVKRGETIFHVPMSVHGKGKQMVPLEIGEVDAVVGNPPYVRQEELPKEYKKLLDDLIETEFPDADLSGRSDIHCYFWPHATSFLKEGGYYGFLTSSAWLDTEYGFHLQEWLLRHFTILALFESNCEPWFTGARVTTVATLMRREYDPAKRAANAIRFVQLRKPLKEVLESFDADPLNAARMLRDFVESLDENFFDDRFRVRVVNQHELWKAGCSGGVARQTKIEGGGTELFQGEYTGGKWGIYLRAPDIFFKLLDDCGPRLVPLGRLAEIRFGVKSGADDFFFVRDVTEEEIQKCSVGLEPGSPRISRRFRSKWEIGISDTQRVRVVESGDGSRHLVEAEYLEPEVHSLMEIDSVEIDPAKLSRKILLVADPPEKLKGTHVLRYIRWGEREGFDQRPSCASRMPKRQWYDLDPSKPGALFWPLAHQYRHIVPLNPKGIITNKRLFDVYPNKGIDPRVLCAILNSTVVALLKYLYGRQVGREGNLDTEVVDARLMLVPDVRETPCTIQQRLESAFDMMRQRPCQPLLRELGQTERITLDDATLESLGLPDSEERTHIRDALYGQMTTLYKEIREVELKKQVERRITARRERASPRAIAEEVWEEFDKTGIRAFPADFTPDGEPREAVKLPAGKPKVLDDLFHKATLQVNGNLIKLGSKVRAEFAAKIVELGHYGNAPIPKADRACERALEDYRRYEEQLGTTFKELAEERSADPDTQSRIVRELWKLYYASARQT